MRLAVVILSVRLGVILRLTLICRVVILIIRVRLLISFLISCLRI